MFIRGKRPVLHRIIFELRYRRGFTYLDRCGKTLNAIMTNAPEWVLKGDQASPQNAPLVSLDNQCTFNFSSHKMDFSLEQSTRGGITAEDIKLFAESVSLLSVIVTDQLGLKEFSRIGLRTLYMFSCSDKKDADRWIQSLGLAQISASLAPAFKGTIEGSGVTVIIEGEYQKYRIALNGVERQALFDLGSELMSVRTSGLSHEQKRIYEERGERSPRLYTPPEFAAMIDIDAYQDEPQSIDPGDFVLTNSSQPLEMLSAAIPKLSRSQGDDRAS